ncbi:MAG TPA: diguanylate cyclase [Bosea sp. (in: a-proteobacteria)]|jgi:diguanylate cyclase (GGDEF)-like protein|uniref:sensor domain-containing diguanylate cyclase n=1 Tax=Bosea sp. (in: a-proteobacteria) TaxID=1871050 RepID=UPI002DDD4D75|nr:diguanylate cyclase [Bosea sp. (in: a-proteobacteria)]HEV2552826.1 diguanylate cyclase [Bosea sp. (in: a-proteobacteria)]
MILSPYLHASLDMLGIAACEYDARLEAVSWNSTFLQFFPEDEGEIYVGEPYADNLVRFYRCRLSPEEVPDVERYIAEGVARHENQTQPFEFIHNGRRLRASSLRAPDGGRVRLWQRLDAEDRAEAAPERVLPVFEALPFIPDGATILDADDRIVAANDAFRQLYGLPRDRPVVGCALDEIIAWCWRGDSPAGAWRAAIRNGLRYDGAPFEIELPGQRWLRVIARHGTGGIGFFTHADITATKRQHIELVEAQAALQRANEELAKLAGTDALTGLANRRAFMAFLAAEAQLVRPLSLLAIDVDHFKAINDRFGHLVGDACLKLIGSIVAEQASGHRRLVARIGGEEFGVVLGGASLVDAHRMGLAIRAALARAPWRRLHPELDRATVSIGLCCAEGPIDEDMLYGCADEALYAAKHNGRDRIESRPLSGKRRTA